MIKQPTFDESFLEEINIPHESNKSKAVFKEYVKNDANITKTELSEKTGVSRPTINKYFEKYNYRERADIYLSYKIKARAEYAIHQGSNFDASNFELSNVALGLLRKTTQYIQDHFDEYLETLPPQAVFHVFEKVIKLQKTNLETAHLSLESLIDNLKYIVKATETGEITDHQAQELMRQLYNEWFDVGKDDDVEENVEVETESKTENGNQKEEM